MFITENNGSEVVRLMFQRSNKAWAVWRKHVAAGKGATPEAIKAWEDLQLANDTVLGDLYHALESEGHDQHRRCPRGRALAELLSASEPAITFLRNRTMEYGRDLGERLHQAVKRFRETR
jgi:hypothetical protein